MATDESTSTTPRTPIECWVTIRDELALAHQHLERARETLTEWFTRMSVPRWREPFHPTEPRE